MKFTKTQSLIKAEQVIGYLQNNNSRAGIEANIECYQNGREHGFIIWNIWTNDECGQDYIFKSKAFYICQGRRTDSVAVYFGDYQMQSISDDAYGNCQTFDQDAEAASKYIMDKIDGEYCKYRMKHATAKHS